MTSWLHEERLNAVIAAIREGGARSVLDLGCGEGDLILRLLPLGEVERISGIDISLPALERLRALLKNREGAERVSLAPGSMTEAHQVLKGFDCAALVETIEHLAPHELSRFEIALFSGMRPRRIIITTPNAEFNGLLGVKPGRFRRHDHRFEWNRAEFRAWASRVAGQAGYAVSISDIGGRHPELGGASQMAVFDLAGAQASQKSGGG